MVISDAAHSLGANINNKCVRKGIEPDVTIFSLHAVKNITTAEGGAICLNLPYPFDNSELYGLLRQMTLNCQTKDAFSKSKAGGWKYDIIDFGMKINLPDVNAAIGLAQIRKLQTIIQNRKRIFTTYNIAFSKFNWAILPPSIEKGKESSYHIYALRINNITEQQRDDIIDEIAKKEMAVNVHFIPLPMLSFFRNKGYDIIDFPQSYKNFSQEISLPLYPQLSDDEVDYVISTVKNAYEKIVVKEKITIHI